MTPWHIRCPKGTASFGPCQMVLHKSSKGELQCCESVRSVKGTLGHSFRNKYIKGLHYKQMTLNKQIIFNTKKNNIPEPARIDLSPMLSSIPTSIILMPFHHKPNFFWQNDSTPYICSRGCSSSCEQVHCTVVSGLPTCAHMWHVASSLQRRAGEAVHICVQSLWT